SQSPHFKAFTEGELIENTDQYSQGGLKDARAEYGKLFFANQPWTIIPTFLAYELMPLPFQIKTPSDLVGFIQNLFRVWLLWVYWRRRQYLDKNTLQSVNMLLLMWLVIDLVYATGTINWGTAARHHTKSLALLLLSGLVVWARFPESHTFVNTRTKCLKNNKKYKKVI
ncbi:MAG: hypothetical protein ACKPE3_02935, partial [Sphaerospermopsis kisseleviana]